MPITTKTGQTLTDSEIDRLAERAEAGLDLSDWKPRRGRPSLAGGVDHSPRIAVRVPAEVRDRAASRAVQEGRSLSDVVRGLLVAYADGSRTAGSEPDRTSRAQRKRP
jgi:hypothetical protein